MKRAPRLCAYAVAMLAVAVLACAALRDGEPEKKGSLEVSGRIVADGGRAPAASVLPAPLPAPAGKSPAAVPPSAAERAPSESSPRDIAEHVRVKALSLARAAASKKAVPASLAEKGSPAPSAEQKTAAMEGKADAPAPSVPGSKPVAEAAPAAPAPTAQPKAALREPAAVDTVQAEAGTKADKAQPRAEKKAPASSPAAKAAGKPAAKPATKAATKTASKAASGAAPARRTESAVEAALADARAGRLAPSGGMVIEKSAARYDRVITSAKYAMKGSLIKLVLRGNAPMVGNFYVLTEPDRVVLDLAGNWEVELPKVPSNRLISVARVGQHDDKTRIVFDMKNTGKVALVPLNRNALELRIQ